MNYLKKKIKNPIIGGNSNASSNRDNNKDDLEDDLYDEFVVEAPPHPSELIALGVNPDEIDVNDPDKLRELYKKAKESGKDKKVNSILLAKERQKEEIEEKKKTCEDWKNFDFITSKIDEAVKNSQKSLTHLKESSAVDKLAEPEYELRLTADQLFKSSASVKSEKDAEHWVDFGEGCGLKISDNDENNNSKFDEINKESDHLKRKADAKRLYHRNMSSFEAASLHLEHQQQLQQQQGDLLNDILNGDQAQTEYIAKMTAEFKSAIEIKDKEFANAAAVGLTTNPFENFDPFETIVDDDISFPSPTPAANSTDNNNTKPNTITANTDKITNNNNPELDENFFNPFETVEDKDALGTPPAIVSSSLEDLQATSQLQVQDSYSTKVPNPTPIHVPSSKISTTTTTSAEADSYNQDHIEPASSTTLMDKGSSSIESVIENVAQRRQSGATNKQVDSTNLTSNGDKENQADTIKLSEDKSQLNSRFRGPPETSALPRPKPVVRPEGEFPVFQPTTPRTPAKKVSQQQQQKKRKEKRRNNNDDDEKDDDSDSSEEDDKIRILIKARNPEAAKADSEGAANVPLPLLPPPPSKMALMQHVRDPGNQLDSQNQQHQIKVNKIDSFEDLPIGEKTKTKRSIESTSSSTSSDHDDQGKDNKKAVVNVNKKNEDYDDDDGGGEDEKRQFVIPMHLSDDDGEGYDKPETPLYDEDTSYALEDYPPKYEGDGWNMMLRYPPKKMLVQNRSWKKIYVRFAQVAENLSAGSGAAKSSSTVKNPNNNNNPSSTSQQPTQSCSASPSSGTCLVLQIFDKKEDKKPMQEIPIQATYTVSEINSQAIDQFGKIFTIRLDYIFYKERYGVRQGQLARFIHSSHIGSSTTSGGHGVDPISIGAIKRIGAPLEHSPQGHQIIKLGCMSYNDIREFKNCLEDYLFKMQIHRDHALTTYKIEEVQMAVRDETYIELNQIGQIMKQLARVRLFFLSFLNGMPYLEVGLNDIHRQGKEVVGRMDILPVVTEEWIRLEACELHPTVDLEEFENPESRLIKINPPDATFFELMRFRVRPPRNRELPLQITASMSVTRTKVSINCDVMVPGCVSRKHGQIPCENIAIRVQIPQCWIYAFREEKHFRMGSKKSVNRRAGKVKGFERFLGGGGQLQDINDDSQLIEVTSGQAKYEHHHQAIVWRAQRWPKDNQSAYVQNTMKIRLPLTAYDEMPETFYEYIHVEYTMPATTVSHTTLRSISVNPCDSDEPPEKYVKYSAKYEYKVKLRLSVNTKPGGGAQSATSTSGKLPERSPIVIMKQPDLEGDLQREEDTNSDSDADEE